MGQGHVVVNKFEHKFEHNYHRSARKHNHSSDLSR